MRLTINIFIIILLSACQNTGKVAVVDQDLIDDRLKPIYTTSLVKYDSDDPAIWINRDDISKSLILGTDKDSDGAIYAFNLEGKEDSSKRINNIKRPNNIDIAYDIRLGDSLIDIAVFTEREKQQIRVFQIPDMIAVDNGGLPVFEDSEYRAVMGVALYKPTDSTIQVIVSRKADSLWQDNYLYQYDLISDGISFKTSLNRKFGMFNGKEGEIEAIAVDQELGFIYYSDELYGIRKYYADPRMGNEQLAVFGLDDFKEDREGISIYKTGDNTGYLLISNQQANEFLVYPREGSLQNQHDHKLIARIPVSTNESDGSEVSNVNFGSPFEEGLFVAMSDNKTFQIYSWSQLKAVIVEQTK